MGLFAHAFFPDSRAVSANPQSGIAVAKRRGDGNPKFQAPNLKLQYTRPAAVIGTSNLGFLRVLGFGFWVWVLGFVVLIAETSPNDE
jgi:hypothetical protein